MSLTLIPYLMMKGNAREAIDFYVQALGAEILNMVTYGDMSMPMPDHIDKKLVAHALLKIGNSELMLSDSPDESVQQGGNVTICIITKDVATTERIFNALKQGGKVIMDLGQVPFSPAYGILTDKFSVPFQISTEANN